MAQLAKILILILERIIKKFYDRATMSRLTTRVYLRPCPKNDEKNNLGSKGLSASTT